MAFRKTNQLAWSGPQPVGPSFSGAEAIADGLVPIHELYKLVLAQVKGVGRITLNRIRASVSEAEMHHWRNASGSVKLIEFYDPKAAIETIVELGEYF